ncbi:MAG: LD-carboxypeptidase [Gemmatimonadetes bacterium]|nr:LD-carboxypeptidase [Gemmatimonadota bacterium]
MHPKPILPPRLAPGATVALVAPSGPLLERDDLTRASELCEAMGYVPRLGPHAGDAYGYLAGRDDDRLADLNAALTDPGIDAVWCIRGGDGMNRIVHRIDFEGFARRPRPVIGFSDITVLLLALWQRTGVVTFHGPIARAPMPKFQRWHFDRVLTSIAPAGPLGRPAPPGDTLVPTSGRIYPLVGGRARGRLVGGNLTLVQALLGTPYAPDTDGAILFLEDVGEDVYRVDRMLAHLRLAGMLDRLAGVAIGRFTELDRSTPSGALGLDEVLHTYFGTRGIPVVVGFPFGHIDDQWTLPVGVLAELDADRGELSLLEPAVR